MNQEIEFVKKVTDLMQHLVFEKHDEWAQVVRQLMTDNIKLYNKIEELQNGNKANASNGKEASTSPINNA